MQNIQPFNSHSLKWKSILIVFIIFVQINSAFSQGYEVKGKIVDQNGVGLAGATIHENEGNAVTTTDQNGEFILNVSSGDAKLTVTLDGYITREINLVNQSSIDISMQTSSVSDQEMVDIGYGTIENRSLVSSISVIKSEELSQAPVPNIIEALRGKVPGVRITRSDGTPGTDAEIKIRGLRYLESTPLLVVDGIPYSGGSISDLNPDDIETVEILKDAAATSIFGLNSSDGVILINTKRGKLGKPSLRINLSTGFNQLVNKPEVFNGQEYTQLKIDAATYQSNPINYTTNTEIKTPEEVLDSIEYKNYLKGNSIDWHEKALRIGKVYNCGVSLSGGNKKVHYYGSMGLYNEKGIVLHTDYKRYSFIFNTDFTPANFIKLGIKTQLSLINADETGLLSSVEGTPDFSYLITNSPLGDITDSKGALRPIIISSHYQYNPFYGYAHSEANKELGRASVTPFIEIKIIKGLTYKINGFYEIYNDKSYRYTDWKFDPIYEEETSYLDYYYENKNYLLDNILSYTNTFKKKHTINLTGIYGNQRYEIKDNSTLIVVNLPEYLSIDDITKYKPRAKPTHSYNFGQEYFAGRINYCFDNRYIIAGASRWENYPKPGSDTKLKKYYSIGAAWNISNEKFLIENKFINTLKYRIDWGEVGNYNINIYPNSVSSWKTSKQFNTGIDYVLLGNRIYGSFDYYTSKNNSVIKTPVSYFHSTSTIYNVKIKNWGIDALMNIKILDGNFKWLVTINWSKDKNKLVDLGPKMVDKQGNPISDFTFGYYIGQDINEIYDYKYVGIYQLADTAIARKLHPDKFNYYAGDPIIADIDGNDTINERDKTYLGSSVTPKWYGSITNTLNYKGFEFSFTIEAVRGIKRYNMLLPNPINGTFTNTLKVDYWMPDNPSGSYPRPRSNRFDYGSSVTHEGISGGAVRLEDASFIAIRNISISYLLPSKILLKTPIKEMLVYIRGNNLKYFTKYTGYTPEQNYGAYPVSKTWMAGFTITF